MIRIALFFLVKNHRGKQKTLLERINMPRSTFNSLLDQRASQIKLAQENAIRLEIENLRLNTEVNDASLLLPTNIPTHWRWAARDLYNRWTLYNSPSPPTLTTMGWDFPKYINDPKIELDPRLFVIPPDIDPFDTHIYQRDPISGIWRKTFTPTLSDTAVPPLRLLTEEEILERCLWFTDWTVPDNEKIEAMKCR